MFAWPCQIPKSSTSQAEMMPKFTAQLWLFLTSTTVQKKNDSDHLERAPSFWHFWENSCNYLNDTYTYAQNKLSKCHKRKDFLIWMEPCTRLKYKRVRGTLKTKGKKPRKSCRWTQGIGENVRHGSEERYKKHLKSVQHHFMSGWRRNKEHMEDKNRNNWPFLLVLTLNSSKSDQHAHKTWWV